MTIHLSEIIDNIYFGELSLTLLGKLIRMLENLADKLKQMNHAKLTFEELMERYPGLSIKELQTVYQKYLSIALTDPSFRHSVRQFEGHRFGAP